MPFDVHNQKRKSGYDCCNWRFCRFQKNRYENSGELIKRLTEIAPCYYVTEPRSVDWLTVSGIRGKTADTDVIILHDRSVGLMKDNERIQIAGLDDPDFTTGNLSEKESALKNKIKGMKLTEDYCILLSHRPEYFRTYVSESIDLVLSGHAHGGQFRLPFIGGLIAPGQGIFPKYDAGAYSENRTTMIVSRGIGNSIIPVRFNNRPEVVIVHLDSI